MKEFEEYLRRIGKSENTALTYCRNIRMYFSWCRDSFGSEPKELYRSNVLEYISYMRNIRGYSPKSVNNHLSALRCLNKYLVQSGRQSDMTVLDSDFMKVQIQYASPCSVDKKEVEAFRQRMLESGSKRDFAIVTLLVYAGLRRSECVNLKLDQVDLIAKEIRVIGKGDKQRLVYINDRIAAAIREYLKERNADSPYLFASRQCAKLSASRIEDEHISAVLSGQDTILPDDVKQTICGATKLHAQDILNQLRELQVDLRSNPAVFIGGGSLLLRPFLEASPLVAKADFVESPNANALGYEMLGRVQLSHRPA